MKTRILTQISISVLLVIWLLSWGGLPGLAQKSGGTNSPTPAQTGPTDPDELEAFLDSVLAAQLKEEHIAGAAVVVVKDGQPFFSKGYGYADVEHGVAVDPETTLFRIASITKLFTWTAVMQLVEQGRLDLNADINTYLDFRIPATLGDEDEEDARALPPITLAHLLTHSAGFEDRAFETIVMDSAELTPLGEWLASHVPARVRPPGELAAYSNYGAALAGYIVERVSGMPYEQYIEQNILAPLDMAHSSARQPLPAELAAQMSQGYFFDGAAFQVAPYEFPQNAPAGAMSASAADMARFMLAHLQEGEVEGARILGEDTTQQMHSIQFRHHPALNGLGYGFIEMSQSCAGLSACDGQHIIGHAGDMLVFHSLLALLPARNAGEPGLGLFVAYNSENGDPGVLLKAFLDHYYPLPEPDALAPPTDLAHADQLAGSYRPCRSAYTTVEKMLGLTTAARVKNAGDGTLLVTTPWAQMQFAPVEPLLFRQVDGDEILAFRADDDGRITHAFFDSDPAVALEKLAWYETPALHIAILAVGGLLLQSVLIVALVTFVRDRRRKRKWLSGQAWPARAACWLLIILALLNLASVILMLTSAPNLMLSLMTGDVAALKIALVINSVVSVLSLGAIIMTVVVWKQGYWNLAGRVYYTLVALTGLLSLWSLNYWNLVGW